MTVSLKDIKDSIDALDVALTSGANKENIKELK